MEKIGTLRGSWRFTCPVYVVEGEIKTKVKNTAAMHSGRFWYMKIRIERQHLEASYGETMLHHEHSHAIHKSRLRHLFWGKKKREAVAEAHAKAMKGKPVPWIEIVRKGQ